MTSDVVCIINYKSEELRIGNICHKTSTEIATVNHQNVRLNLKPDFKDLYNIETLCTIWYHYFDFENVENTYGGVLLSTRLQNEACNFTKNTSP